MAGWARRSQSKPEGMDVKKQSWCLDSETGSQVKLRLTRIETDSGTRVSGSDGPRCSERGGTSTNEEVGGM